MALTYTFYTEVEIVLPPFLLFPKALYLSKVEKSISNNSRIYFTSLGDAFTLEGIIDYCEKLGSTASFFFISLLCQNMDEALDRFNILLYL